MPQRTLADLAELCGAELDGDGARLVSGPADLASAGAHDVSFLANVRYTPLVESTKAAAVVIARDAKVERDDLILLRVDDPNSAFSKVVSAFAQRDIGPAVGVHPSAVVHPGAQLGSDVAIGALCSVGEGAQLGDGAVLHPGVCIGAGASVGARTVIFANVSLYARVSVGADCIIHSGTVIGADGFGFQPTPQGWDKIPQCGTVVVEDDVEIGGNCVIDRARFGATTLRRGVKLDNLVHIAHNVSVGEASLLCGQVGTSGSSKIGQRVVLAGQVGLLGHITIGDGAQVGGQAGVTRDVEPGAKLTGSPARPLMQTRKDEAHVRKLSEYKARLRALEARLEALEGAVKADD